MIISMNDNGIINSTRLVSIMINPFDESELIYTMADGQFFKEKFEGEEEATEAFEAIEIKTFIDLTNNRKINGMYAKDVLIDPLDDTKVVFVIYNGAPQKEKYDTNALAKSRVTDAISKLKTATEFEDGGDPSDLTNYYTKAQADEKFAAKSSLGEYIKTTDADGKYAQKTEITSYVQTTTAESTYAKKSEIPTTTSQLSNDSNFVEDADYVHTDENFTTALKGKLDGLNNYTLPTANGSTLGGIKLGTGLTDAGGGVINVDFSSINSQISALEGRIEALEAPKA